MRRPFLGDMSKARRSIEIAFSNFRVYNRKKHREDERHVHRSDL